MLKVLLIDDEERATDALRRMIGKLIPEIGQVAVCNDARQAGGMIRSFQPSLIFLDIRMPHLSGFDLLDNIPSRQFRVIFTTAFNEYAIKAIRFSAFDYLLKPVDAEELVQAVNRFLLAGIMGEEQQGLLHNIRRNLRAADNEEPRLALPTREGVHYVMPHEVVRCEAMGNYTKFHTADNRQFVISKTLREYEELLAPYHFVRTHKTHLINRTFVSFMDHDGFLVLKDGTRIEVSRRRKDDVRNAMKGT